MTENKGYKRMPNDRFETYRVKAVKIQDTTPQIEKAIVEQIKYTGQRMDLSNKQMGDLLGIHLSTVGKIYDGQRTISLETFLNFCRLFNLDISQIVNSSYLRTSDEVHSELVTLLGGLKDETLEDIIDCIKNSDESDAKKKRAVKLIDKLKNTKDTKLHLYAEDMPDDK